jgi:predicted permease
MKALDSFWRWCRSLLRRTDVKREIDEELRFHLEMRTAENMAAGMPPEEAARAARRRFGNVQSVREDGREIRGADFGEGTLRDLRLGLKSLGKHPGFTAVSVLTLALGIGISTAIFSVVNPLWFNTLPTAEPDHFVGFRLLNHEDNQYSEGAISPVIIQELRAHPNYFADLTRATWNVLLWENGRWTETVYGCNVSPNFFSFWRAKPWLGQTFSLDDGRPGTPPVVVLSYEFWKNQKGGDPGCIGEPLRFGLQDRTVIGVMPPSFNYPYGTAFWVPGDEPQVWPGGNDREAYRCNNEVIARLAPGVSIKRAQVILDMFVRRHKEGHRKAFEVTFSLHLRPAREIFTSAGMRKTIPGFVGAMIFVLLIACANVANLNLARTEARQHELAIRCALGAGRYQLLRQLLLESLLPALAGAVAGLVLTYCTLSLNERLLPDWQTRVRPIALDWQVLAFSLLITVTAGLISGTVPAWYGATRPVAHALKQSGVQVTPGVLRNLYRRGLVVLEVSLAVLLLAGAGLMVQSVVRLLRADVGFEPTNLLCIGIQPAHDSELYRTLEVRNLLLDEIHRRLSAVPGVEAVGILLNGFGQGRFAVTGQKEPVELRWSGSGVGAADAFQAMRAPLVRGRTFDERDLGTNATAVLVNETLARHCWPGENPVGKTIQSMAEGDHSRFEVVGVVADTRPLTQARMTEPVQAMFYRPQQAVLHWGAYEAYHLFVRTRVNPEGLIKPLLEELKAAGPELRKPEVGVVKDVYYNGTRAHRIYMWYLAIFGAVGLLLASVGVYSVVAYSVVMRRGEIGIRMALGATQSNIVRMVLRQGMTVVGIGIGLGVGTACALTRLLHTMLYGVSPLDPLTLAAAALLLGLSALLACYIPARRAARVDPMTALRYE